MATGSCYNQMMHSISRARTHTHTHGQPHGLFIELLDDAICQLAVWALRLNGGVQPLVLKAEWPLGRPSRGKRMNAARLERQRLFTSACRQHGITHLLVAHQAGMWPLCQFSISSPVEAAHIFTEMHTQVS